MTQMLAEFKYSVLRKHTGATWLSKHMLQWAKHNLAERYFAFGIKEEFSQSISHLEEMLGIPALASDKIRKRTRRCPKRSERPALTLDAPTEAHQPDIELYAFAVELFAARTRSLVSHP
jgi:hypothetical protein